MATNLMTNIIEIDKPNVCFIGDIHGDFNGLQSMMKHTCLRDTAYIVCGDIGFGFNKKQYYTNIFNKLSRTASKLNCVFLFIRGNHDDRTYFDKKTINRKCFRTISDYTVIKTPNHNILCVGGAISIDRTYRLSVHKENAMKYAIYHGCSLEEAEKLCPKVYWADEPCYYNKQALEELKLNNVNIDIVCTHTCPSFVKPLTKDKIKSWLERDSKLEKDIDNERKVMDDIYYKLKSDGHKLEQWFYGHYHFHNCEYVENTKFVMLDMCRNGNIYDIYDIQY